MTLFQFLVIALGVLANLILLLILLMVSGIIKELQVLRFNFLDATWDGLNQSYLHQIRDDLAGLTVTVSLIQERQERGPWEPSEAP